ncbi:MAG TPA: glycosyltransferase family 39 protein [Longimicrobiales bacterium]|nr:glycosyltransferase family 39 protein [Longimicrobiales bacterium]
MVPTILGRIRSARDHAPPEAAPLSAAEPALARLLIGLTLVALAAGVVARLFQFLQRPSLWMDELLLSLDVVTLPFGRLAGPLPFEQVAPVLFVWAQHLSIAAFGVGEAALRLVPLLSGLLLLPLVAWSAWRLGGPRAALIAGGLAAVAPLLVRYSNEAKQYEGEAFVAAAMTALTIHMLGRAVDRRRALLFVLAGLVALGFSVSAIFVVAAAWSAVALDALGRRDRRAVPMLAASALLWPATFLGLYRLGYSDPATQAYLARFWANAYLFAGEHSVGTVLGRIFVAPVSATTNLTGSAPLPLRVLLWLLAVAGCWRLSRRELPALALLLLPFALVIAAAVLGRYVVAGRLLLFFVPGLLVLVGLGADTVVRRLPAPSWAVLPLGALLAFVPARWSFYSIRNPAIELPREAVRELLGRRGPGEPVYVSARSIPSWAFYTTDWRSSDRTRLSTLLRRAVEAGPNSGNAPSRGHAVRNEGYDRLLTTAGRLEVLGIASGLENAGLPVPETPDPGWAENEVDRLRATGSPTAWLYLHHQRQEPVRELVRAVEAAGGRVLLRLTEPDSTRVLRVALPPPIR